jgi:hypothetical protein
MRAHIMIKNRTNVALVIATMALAVIIASHAVVYSKTIHAQTSNPKPLETFTARGLIGSLIFNNTARAATQSNVSSSVTNKTNANTTSTITNAANNNPYILVGNWSLSVINKKITYFDVNFTMVHIDGTDRHTHELTNFKRISVVPILLDRNGITFIGMMDIKLNGADKWFGVPITVSIGKQFNTISIITNPKYTDNHFMRQPIFGVFTSLKDQSGTELIITRPAP